jgi:methionyl-tRNA formyltransferase
VNASRSKNNFEATTLKTVFFGTPKWAIPTLEALMDSPIEVAGVVTNPDRPSGRGMKLQPSPVKESALAAGLDVMQPEKARDPSLADWVRARGADVATVVAYGKILPLDLLEVPLHGFVNVHFSLLPEYRGAAPVQRALMDGKTEAGVSIMRLTAGMDEGPVFALERVPVEPNDTAGSVGDRLAEVGAGLLVRTLLELDAGTAQPHDQDDARATYAPKITDEQARIDWASPADSIRNLVRGLNPAPGAWTTLGDRRLKVHAVGPSEAELSPGQLAVVDDSLVVGTGEGSLELVEVQPAGKRRMPGSEFARGLRLEPQARLGT